jgi:hypothetical protein
VPDEGEKDVNDGMSGNTVESNKATPVDEETVSANKGKEKNVVDLEDDDSMERPLVKTYGSGITKRLRSKTGKVVVSENKTNVETKQGKKSTRNHVLYGPKRTQSKNVPATNKKKKSPR